MLKLNWDNWLYGLGKSVISGGASALVAAGVAPMLDADHFNPTHAKFYELVFGMFLGKGLIAMFQYLSQSPLPEVESPQGPQPPKA